MKVIRRLRSKEGMMSQLRKLLDEVLSVLAGASLIAMVLLTCWQVLTRYILGNPSSWSEELVGYLFAWMSLFGACLVTGERGHMNIPLLAERLSPGMQKALEIFAEIVACIFALVILLYGGVQITNLAMGQKTSSLGVAVGVFYVVLPAAGILNILYTVINMIDLAKGTFPAASSGEGAQAMEKANKEAGQ